MAIHGKETVRPSAGAVTGMGQRPVLTLHRCPKLRRQARGADRARVPSHRRSLACAISVLLPGLLHGLAALLERRLSIARDRGLYRLDQSRQRRFGVAGHGDIDRLEALEVLEIRLGVEFDAA